MRLDPGIWKTTFPEPQRAQGKTAQSLLEGLVGIAREGMLLVQSSDRHVELSKGTSQPLWGHREAEARVRCKASAMEC